MENNQDQYTLSWLLPHRDAMQDGSACFFEVYALWCWETKGCPNWDSHIGKHPDYHMELLNCLTKTAEIFREAVLREIEETSVDEFFENWFLFSPEFIEELSGLEISSDIKDCYWETC